jgi:hypothetical protein
MQGSRTRWLLLAVVVMALPVGATRSLAYQDPDEATTDESAADAGSDGQDQQAVADDQDDSAESADAAAPEDEAEGSVDEQGEASVDEQAEGSVDDTAEVAGDETATDEAATEDEAVTDDDAQASEGAQGEDSAADEPTKDDTPQEGPAATPDEPAKAADGCDFARREACLADCRVKHPQGDGAYGAWNPADKDKCDSNCIYTDQPACAPKDP